jgi:DNA-binding CsgD family transcriptional regulator
LFDRWYNGGKNEIKCLGGNKQMENIQSRSGLYGFEFVEHDKRRAEEGERKTYQIKQLWQRSHEIVNLAALGYKNEDIALILNVHPGTVSNTLNSDLGKVKLAEVRKGRDDDAKKLSEKIRVLRDKALNVYNEIFDDESGESTLKDKKAVADTVALDLAGLRSPTKVQGVHANIQLTPEELEGFKQRGIEAAKEEGIVINVETESETERNKEENRKDG